MKIFLSRHAKLLSLAVLASGSLFLSACGGGGGGDTTGTGGTGGSGGSGGSGGGGGGTTPPAVVVIDTTTPAAQAAKQFLQEFDTLRSSFKSAGSDYYSLHDACLLDNGNTKAFAVSEWDADANRQARTAFEIGSTRATGTVTVAAERTVTTANGSRRELDIEYTTSYTDGSRANASRSTIISGSSEGAIMANGTACATPESKAQWRFYGNREKVGFSMTATNEIRERQNLSNGADRTPSTFHNKYINIALRDPANVATYYTISGPAIRSVSTGATVTLIAVSPRVLRDAPEFAGKIGNADWRDTDSFRFCRVSTSNGLFALAELANCPVSGASSSSFGSFDNQTATVADSTFDANGFAVGQVYTVKVYNDDGWKTVNGFANKTPTFTINHTLRAVPYSAAALEAGNKYADPQFTVTSVAGTESTAVKLAQLLRNKSAFTAQSTWTPPAGNFPDGTVPSLNSLALFVQGSTSATVAPASWPRSRNFYPYYAAAGSTTSSNISQAALNPAMSVVTYGQLEWGYTSRNGNLVTLLVSFD